MAMFKNPNQNDPQGQNPQANNNNGELKLNIPANEEMPISLDLSSLKSEPKPSGSFLINKNTDVTATNPTENIQVSPNPTPTIQPSETHADSTILNPNENRLAKEDALVAAKEQAEQPAPDPTPTIEIKKNIEIKSDVLNMFEETPTPEIPVVAEPIFEVPVAPGQQEAIPETNGVISAPIEVIPTPSEPIPEILQPEISVVAEPIFEAPVAPVQQEAIVETTTPIEVISTPSETVPGITVPEAVIVSEVIAETIKPQSSVIADPISEIPFVPGQQEAIPETNGAISAPIEVIPAAIEQNTQTNSQTETPAEMIANSIISTPQSTNTVPQQETQVPSANLQTDQAIIEKLKDSMGQAAPKQGPIFNPNSPTEVNLDDIISTPTPTQGPVVPIPNQTPLETGIHGYQVPKNPIENEATQIHKPQDNKKLLASVGMVILLLGVGFVLRKQYPIEAQNLLGTNNQIEDTLPIPEEIFPGDESMTGDTENEVIDPIEETTGTGENTPTETGDNSDINPALINYHPAPTDSGSNFNAYEDFENMISDDQKNKEQILDYKEEGKKYIVLGIKKRDKDVEKYGRFLYARAEELLQNIENGTEITTGDLSELENYLQKLTGKGSNGETLNGSTGNTQPTSPEEGFSGTQNNWQLPQ